MKYDLEQASLLYLGKLLSNESYYTEELEDTYINLKGAIEERNKLQQENQRLKSKKPLKDLKERNDTLQEQYKLCNIRKTCLEQANKQLKDQIEYLRSGEYLNN